jgi:hypothetical protein
MVVRAALGLSASGGKVCAVIRDTLPGWITLATARILANAGASVHVLFLLDPDNHSEEVAAQLKPLERMGVPLEHWTCRAEGDQLAELLSGCHNVLCALTDLDTPLDEVSTHYVGILNELSVPVHAVEFPPGLDPDSGVAAPATLIASSTLSLGAPLLGLHKGKDFVGRHYLCDISIPRGLYESVGVSVGSVFADQPVQQIFPTTEPLSSPT